MLTRLKQGSKSENFFFFRQFFMVFTGIFIVMTVIILQVMRVGLYSSVDGKLTQTAKDIDHYVDWVMATSNHLDDTQDADLLFKIAPTEKLASNTDFIFYDDEGNVLNHVFRLSEYSNLTLKKKKLNAIYTESYRIGNHRSETYHLMTVKVTNDTYPELRYATVAVNVTQIEEVSTHYSQIIIGVMGIFWLVSIGASVYLTKWSMKPILDNYEKQKSFVENASHELRTPLAVLQNRLETLFRKPDATVMDNYESIASSLDEVRNMRLLTTNLLNLARRDDGIKPDMVEVGASFFEDIFENYALIAQEEGRVFISNTAVSRSILTDKTLLKQVMTIVFDNAIKYTDKNGVIEVCVKTTEKHLCITFKDNGLGISDQDKSRIFERFYRVDKARTRQKGGFGLGLSLASQIIHSLKGTITVKDNSPKGSIFEIVL